MNDNFNPYMENGEIIYIGKADSVKTFAGEQRFLLEFIVKDPRANALYVFWNQQTDSIIVPVPDHNPDDVFSIMVGDETLLNEGSYTLELVSKSADKYKSVSVVASVNVYGNKFRQTLVPKIVRSVVNSNGNITISWGGAISEKELGVALKYVNVFNHDTVVFRTTKELKNPTVLSDVELTQGIDYKTFYLPETTAIDTFFVEAPIVIPTE
jgi:hypothetical protein